MEQQVVHIRENLVSSQDRQKKYVDAQRLDHHFPIGDRVFLRACLRKSPIYYEKGFKLVPHFVKPFEILNRIGPIAYQLALPPSLSCIHDIFHVSVLRQYILDVTHVLDWDALQLVDGQLTLEPIHILQHQRLTLRG